MKMLAGALFTIVFLGAVLIVSSALNRVTQIPTALTAAILFPVMAIGLERADKWARRFPRYKRLVEKLDRKAQTWR